MNKRSQNKEKGEFQYEQMFITKKITLLGNEQTFIWNLTLPLDK